MKPQTYLKRQHSVEAMQWDGTVENAAQIIGWIRHGGTVARLVCTGECDVGHRKAHIIKINSADGEMTMVPHDWVVRGVLGTFVPCNPETFTKLYVELQEHRKAHLDCGTDVHEGIYVTED